MQKVNRMRAAWVTAVALLFVLYIWGLSTNPPAFYLDESALAYNAYMVSQTGGGEFGDPFPLYFELYEGRFTQHTSPSQIYLLGLVFAITGPSILVARIFSAFWVFAACMLIGLLARRLSGNTVIGAIVALTALITPWLIDIRGVLLEPHFIPFATAVFLLAVFRATQKDRWGWLDAAMMAGGLCLITYCYTSGRGLGVILAAGLAIFATKRAWLLGVVKTWVLYGIGLVPILIYNLQHPGALTRRLYEVSYLRSTMSVVENATMFTGRYLEDINPTSLLLYGDSLHRHHIQGAGGAILFGTFILMILGLLLVVIYRRSDRWWLYILFGLFAAVVPGAIANDRFHQSRLMGCVAFILILTVPALEWLIVRSTSAGSVPDRFDLKTGWGPRRVFLAILMIATLAQGVFYQVKFRTTGIEEDRQLAFDASYPRVLKEALSHPQRPIYLHDGKYGPAYIHAYWYGTLWGVDRSNFVHLKDNEIPPAGSLVISSEGDCRDCAIAFRDYIYVLYRVGEQALKGRSSEPGADPPKIIGSEGTGDAQFSKPRGVSADKNGNVFVADSGNSRIQKFGHNGDLVATFGQAGTEPGQLRDPNGIDVDKDGNIYVTDSFRHKLIKFDPKGEFVTEWGGDGFHGPRDIVFGPDGYLYIVDQGRNRIVKFDPRTEAVTPWGGEGNADGQFASPSGIAIGDDLVFVADAGNDRIQVFDLNGKFIRQWAVPSWQNAPENFPDLVFDPAKKRLYVTNSPTKEILTFDTDGEPGASVVIEGEVQLEKPSAIALDGKHRELFVVDTTSSRVFQFTLAKEKEK